MHYYQFNIGDYASHTSRLKPIEDLAYRRMLDLYYLNEQPLSLCLSDVARELGLTDYLDEVAYVLNKFFIETESGFSQKRIDLEIKKYKSNHKSKIKAGKASAKARQSKASSVETPIEHPLNTRTTNDELNINHKPLTNNQEPLTNNQEPPVKDKDLPPKVDVNELFEKVWKQYPSKQNKKKALATFTAYVKKKKLDVEDFADYLIKDICERCNSQQFGFDKLHFTTYMNGERWFDEITQNLSDADAKHEAWKRSIQETDYTDLLGGQ
jgi:uncharacterized protein YdaU (DUF1376 family)